MERSPPQTKRWRSKERWKKKRKRKERRGGEGGGVGVEEVEKRRRRKGPKKGRRGHKLGVFQRKMPSRGWAAVTAEQDAT